MLPLRVPEENTDAFSEWYFETHGGTGQASWEQDDDVDEVEFDDMDDKDE